MAKVHDGKALRKNETTMPNDHDPPSDLSRHSIEGTATPETDDTVDRFFKGLEAHQALKRPNRPPGCRPIPQAQQYKIVAVEGNSGLLGEGGQGAVWAAEDESGNRVAIKFVYPEYQERVKRAVAALKRIGPHPNVIRIIGEPYELTDGLAVVMPRAKHSLLKYVAEGKWRGDQPLRADLLNLMKGAAAGVDYLNGNGIRHRDIKPENLLEFADGTVVVSDPDYMLETSKAIATASYVGTEGYIAFETENRNQYTPRSDLAAFAKTYLTLRTSRRPGQGEIPDPAEATIVAQACQEDWVGRHVTCTAFIDNLYSLRPAVPKDGHPWAYKWAMLIPAIAALVIVALSMHNRGIPTGGPSHNVSQAATKQDNLSGTSTLPSAKWGKLPTQVYRIIPNSVPGRLAGIPVELTERPSIVESEDGSGLYRLNGNCYVPVIGDRNELDQVKNLDDARNFIFGLVHDKETNHEWFVPIAQPRAGEPARAAAEYQRCKDIVFYHYEMLVDSKTGERRKLLLSDVPRDAAQINNSVTSNPKDSANTENTEVDSIEIYSYRVDIDPRTGVACCVPIADNNDLPRTVTSYDGIVLHRIANGCEFSKTGKWPASAPVDPYAVDTSTWVLTTDPKTAIDWLVVTINGEGQKGGVGIAERRALQNAIFYSIATDKATGKKTLILVKDDKPK